MKSDRGFWILLFLLCAGIFCAAFLSAQIYNKGRETHQRAEAAQERARAWRAEYAEKLAEFHAEKVDTLRITGYNRPLRASDLYVNTDTSMSPIGFFTQPKPRNMLIIVHMQDTLLHIDSLGTVRMRDKVVGRDSMLVQVLGGTWR